MRYFFSVFVVVATIMMLDILMYWNVLKMVMFFSPLTRYRQKKHLVDVTEIFNMLSWEKKQRLIKLFYLVLTLFLSVFWYGTPNYLSNVMNFIKYTLLFLNVCFVVG
jgi:hypothetical protein